KDLVIFTRQLTDLVEASVPILRSLKIISEQTESPLLKTIVEDMHQLVKDGGSFSDALAKYPEIFSRLYVSLVRTGELSGRLEEVLVRLASYLEKEQATLNKVTSSLVYPLFILGVGIISVFVLLTFVVPRITVMFADLDQALPLPTLILVSLSNVLAKYWWLVVLLVGILVMYTRSWLLTAQGRRKFDTWRLKLPYIGEFLRVVEVGRFARTLGTLVESGVPIASALTSVATTLDNVNFREEIERMTEEVKQGGSLRTSLKKSQFFPDMAVNMISVGEETGRLERGLYKIADIFERQADQTVKTIVALLGPVVLVFIILVIGSMVVALMLPIFKMNLLIQ
ncbi:MAG: type II secretion system F family protein, partial [Candidatus Omnitrophota bacterium]|nr:type II secretion system F family protein [Candidatus Omnitrophota bacterium]